MRNPGERRVGAPREQRYERPERDRERERRPAAVPDDAGECAGVVRVDGRLERLLENIGSDEDCCGPCPCCAKIRSARGDRRAAAPRVAQRAAEPGGRGDEKHDDQRAGEGKVAMALRARGRSRPIAIARHVLCS